ncbi:hypothetical protein Rhopal_007397-T1 [Rhodotorula paludigena]|uniref:Proteophosphoglycan 5 n=1 Tax=Rhodotorula paludigena TaxID=86838 RepID=A0AAV5GVQ8_9BASI|nr:hypothetical protein Rhopal_007397-T1 [Rhodotorula paludigena]
MALLLFLMLSAWTADPHDLRQRVKTQLEQLKTQVAGLTGGNGEVCAVGKEQESRAQHHLVQLAVLARTLNLTLVLPPLASSRFSHCGATSFDELYSLATFERENGVRAIPDRDFDAWRASLPTRALGAQALVITQSPGPGESYAFVPLGSTSDYAPSRCLNQTGLSYARRPPLRYRLSWRGGPRLLDDLRALDVQLVSEGVDVLVVSYAARTLELSDRSDAELDRSFVYAPAWQALARAALEQMGSGVTVGVHWRTEGIEPARLEACAEGLVASLLEMGRNEGVTNVYLATDYPLEALEGYAEVFGADAAGSNGGAPDGPARNDHHRLALGPVRSHSDTLHPSAAHDAAMSAFLVALGTLSRSVGLSLATFHSLAPSLPDPRGLASHRSAASIVSQLVLRQTEIFVAGLDGAGAEKQGREECARRSSWTYRVTTARREALEAGEGRVREELRQWSTDGRAL